MKFKSCAKINLSLEIHAPRADGYHSISSLMQSVSLCDELDFETNGLGLRLSVPPQVPGDKDNIIFKAAELFAAVTGKAPAVSIGLKKTIPVGAGLGGGSSNAATTLLALNQLLDAGLDSTTLNHMASQLGCDVPFFLQQGLAWARGKGESLTVLPPTLPFFVIILYPGFPIHTAWAYRQFARQGRYGDKDSIAAMLQAFRQNDFQALCSALYNDFEPVIFKLYPQLQELKAGLRQSGCEGVLMSGSGSCIFGLVQEQDQAEFCLKKFQRQDRLQAFLARSL